MTKFKIWFIDDIMAPSLCESAPKYLGPYNSAYADWEVIAQASQAIDRFRGATCKGDLPDVALIDVNFDARASAPPLNTINSHSVGFVIAAELQHYSRLLKKEYIYTIYTGNNEVINNYRDLYNNPFGHEPLLPVIEKSDLQSQDIMDWAHDAVVRLAARRIRNGNVDLSISVCDWLDGFLRDFEETVEKPWKKCRGARQTKIVQEVANLFSSWERVPRHQRLGYLRSQELQTASSKEEIIAALDISTAPFAAERKVHIEKVLDETEAEYNSRLFDIQGSFEILKKALMNHPEFPQITSLFPFETQRIAAQPLGDIFFEDTILALRNILNVLGAELDYNYTLARAIKYLLVPGEKADKYVPTTVLAHACHSWRKDKWPFDFPEPESEEERELLLREELGRGKVQDSSRTIPLLVLPEATLNRFEEDGKRVSGKLGTSHPLLTFAKKNKYGEWIAEPAECLRNYLARKSPGAKVSFVPEDFAKREVLTDWRNFFDTETGLISEILLEEKITGITDAEIRYDEQQKAVSIILNFQVEEGFYFGPLDLREGGGLRDTLRRFLGWGKLTLHTNIRTTERDTCFRTPWPGGAPQDYRGDTARGLFKLEWQLAHYLRTRCQP
jgi:hypothetical protein